MHLDLSWACLTADMLRKFAKGLIESDLDKMPLRNLKLAYN